MPTKFKQIISTTHFSNIISQLCGITKEFIVRKFPDNYFKDIYMTTEDFSVRLGNLRNKNLHMQSVIKKFPRLAIRPTYNAEESILRGQNHDDWMNRTMRQGRLTVEGIESSYNLIFSDMSDDRNEVRLYTLPKSNKMTFDFSIAVESEMVLYDVLNFIREEFIFNRYFYLSGIWMYSIIPYEIIDPIADWYGYDLTDKFQRLEFCDLLQKRSNKYIEDILVSARGERFFAFKFKNNILMKLEIPSGEKSKKNMVTSMGEIKFTGELQTSTPSNFAGVIYDYGQRQINMNTQNINGGVKVFDKVIQGPKEFIGDKMLIAYKGFIAENEDGSYSSVIENRIENIPLDELGNKELISCMDYCDNICDYSLMDIKVFSNNDKGYISDADFKVDWRTRTLKLNKYKYGTVYYIAVYMDRRYMKDALEKFGYAKIDGTVTKEIIVPNNLL